MPVGAIRSSAALLVAGLLAAGCGGGGGDSASTRTSSGPCTPAKRPAPKTTSFKRPASVLGRGASAFVVVKTNCGSFTIELATSKAPKTTNSFAFLASKGFYANTFFHRIAPDFVIQGGDPTGSGTGDAGYRITEAPPSSTAYLHGAVAMAKGGNEPPGASGSQFFVVTTGDAGLPPEYALVGKVTKGLDVVDMIGRLGDANQKPTTTVVIKSATLER